MSKLKRLLAAGILCAAVAGTCATAGAADTSTFTYAITSDPGANVNPITSSDRFGLMTSNLVYSPLFKIDGDEYVWYLATGYELSEDGRTYTFTLRDDVTWTDGEAFTADDVIFTIEAIMDPNNASEMYSNFVSEEGACEIEKIDDYTVAFTFPNASPAHMEAFAYEVYIIPEHVFADVDFLTYEFSGPSVTTGAYILTEYSAGSYLKFEKNEDYFMNTPSIDTIVFRIITSDDTAMLAIQSGEVDAWPTSPSYLAQIDLEASNLTAYTFNQGRVGYLEVNTVRIPDTEVRQAIFYALDKTELATATYLDAENYDEVYTFLPPNNTYYDDSEVEKYEQDIEKAQSLLEEAGVENLTLTIGYASSDATMETWALLIQQQLSAVGITCELSPMESNAYYDELENPDKSFDLYFGGYIMGSDPQTYRDLFASDGSFNYTGWVDEEIDSLFEQGISTFDTEERAAVYSELQQVIQDDAFFYPIASNNYIVLINNRVEGVEECGLVPIYTLSDASYLTLSE
ncbi:MAG: ABC transporter substrate-binding protein [Lachnospiraceae bacterium]|nr:ABC transporter substrate-binding protein [Lachnospiraceae bacterium]